MNISIAIMAICGTICWSVKIVLDYRKKKLENPIKRNWISDVTKMNYTRIDNIFYVKNSTDVLNIIDQAKRKNKKISIAGQHHTMGGHTITENGYQIDTKYFNRILDFDANEKTVTVEPGITWSDLIKFLNEHGLSPMVMQSYSSFSVGGTIFGPNAHGITCDYGMHESVIEFKIITAQGEFICNREKNSELFSLAIGGYGLFGIVVSIKLKIVPNVCLSMEFDCLDVPSFKKKYLEMTEDPSINIKLGRINVCEMKNIALYGFRTKSNEHIVSSLGKAPHEMSKPSRLLYKWIIPWGWGQWIRYQIEKLIQKPLDWSNDCERNKLLYETAAPMGQLYNPLIDLDRTHILQEYFVPKKYFESWIGFFKQIISETKFKRVTLLNVTIRYLKKDSTTLLRYAKIDMFAFVFYYRIERHEESETELKMLHDRLVNATLELDGTFYLPYRHHYNTEQFLKAYPEFPEFVSAKNKIDPDHIFMNQWFAHYSNSLTNKNNSEKTYKLEPEINEPVVCETNSIKRVSNTPNFEHNSYQIIFASPILTYKFKEFLKNIFYIMDPDELFVIVGSILEKNPNASDIDVFNNIRINIGFLAKIKNSYSSVKILSDQRKDFVGQIFDICRALDRTELHGYASMGDPGRNVKMLSQKLKINGPKYILHDKQSIIDILERNSIRSVGKFIQFDYIQVPKMEISDCSLDLFTIMMGLHHFPVNRLPDLLKNVHRVLRHNGLFIIREHNAYPELFPIVNAAHNIFNAVTSETLENEKKEIRQFRTVNEWIQIMKTFGFEDVGIYGMQENDPTEDFMICFRKIPTSTELALDSIHKYTKDTKLEYERGLHQTYATLTEWQLVDVAKEFAKFLEHTPYYMFPYWRNIKLFWYNWYRSARIVQQKCGFSKAYLSEYTMASIVMGITVTAIFALMSFLSVAPRLMYSSGENLRETGFIKMIIKSSKDLDPEKIDDRITVCKSITNDNDVWMLIEVPRYLPFKEIVTKLAKKKILFLEICGQKEIQVKLRLKHNSKQEMDFIKNLNGCFPLFEYSLLENSPMIEVPVSMEIEELTSIFDELEKKRIPVLHIFDF